LENISGKTSPLHLTLVLQITTAMGSVLNNLS